jgi:hypothetical protein
LYIEYASQGDYAEAKKVGYKLPFSFIQRDWKNHSIEELKQAHQGIYELDYRIKNGGDESFLEHFYIQAMSAQFSTVSRP